MKNVASPSIQSLSKKVALALPLALAICAPSVFAQASFDTSTLGGAASTTGTSQALTSLGSAGTTGNSTYLTGTAPNSAGLSGNTSNFTSKQLTGPTGTLILPYAGTGGLAPIFGMGSSSSLTNSTLLYTTNLLNNEAAALTVTGLGTGLNANLNVGNTDINVNAVGSSAGF